MTALCDSIVTMIRGSVVALSSLLVLAFASTSFGGEEGKARARALYQSGTSHYNLSEFKEALVDFKEAYRLLQDPSFLFNIAQCHRQLGDPAAAASFYRAFRREAPDAPNRADVDRLIGEMDKAAAQQHGPPQETLPTSGTAAATAPAQPTATTNVVITTSPPSPRKPLAKRPWFWATLGGAAVVIAGVTVAVVLGTAQRAPTPSVGRVNGNRCVRCWSVSLHLPPFAGAARARAGATRCSSRSRSTTCMAPTAST